MSIVTTTHLNFTGQARPALEFYRSVFGGEIITLTYAQAHSVQDPSEADQVMWSQLEGGNGIRLMAYDVPTTRMPYEPGVNPVFVSVQGDDAAEITAYWEGLSAGATVVHDLAPTGWSPLYGMLADRFGVVWVLAVSTGYAAG